MAETLILSRQAIQIPDVTVEDKEKEAVRFRSILEAAGKELEDLYHKAVVKLGPKEGGIFDAQLSILRDEYSTCLPIEEMIRSEACSAARAIEKQFDILIGLFSSLDDQRLKERAADAADLKELMLRHALGLPGQTITVLDKDVIIVADELAPSDTVKMDTAHVVGIVTRAGGVTSHTAIIARTLGIPAVVQLNGWENLFNSGAPAILDGDKGMLTVFPTEEEIACFLSTKEEQDRRTRELEPYKTMDSIAVSGERFEICANIGTPGEVAGTLAKGADGIGLFRSEFLFMNRGDVPSEGEQFEAYRSVLSAMGNRQVIIRTLDVGGDKDLPAMGLPAEANPFLGYRAIRICLDRPDIFVPQLRAMLRASAYGNLGIMFPMISSIGEFRRAGEILEDTRCKLKNEGVTIGNVTVGIMVEIPAAAVLADQFAEEADFFSIGTNDLTQYTLAAERGNPRVEDLSSPYHPAVLKLISMTAKAAREHGIMCGMCGEAAGDPHLIPIFAGMGVTELSMSPSLILQARKTICSLDMDDCYKAALRVTEMRDIPQVKEFLGVFD